MSYREIHYHSQEGLRLYAKDYGDRATVATPIVCLPGLTRNSKDFDSLAERLAPTRRVLCPDLRGRGKSDYANRWTDYTPTFETADTLDMMSAAGISDAIIVGTSRGGIIAMLMAAIRPCALKGVILNDIGPELAPAGLRRIMGYAGRMEAPGSWDEAAIRLRQMNEHHFPDLNADQWRAFSARTFADENGKPRIDYDPKIGIALRRTATMAKGEAPTLWPQFRALRHLPVLAIRGENSDLLSKETLARMTKEHPRLATITARDRGHAPFLDEPEVLDAIDVFLAGTD